MLAVQQQKRLCRQFVDVSAARRGCHTMKCRSTCNIGNRCQKVRDIFRRVSQKRLVNPQAQLVLDPLSNWQPVQLSKSWSHTVTLKIHNGACGRCVQDSLERCQRESWKIGQHGVAIVQTRQDKCCI